MVDSSPRTATVKEPEARMNAIELLQLMKIAANTACWIVADTVARLRRRDGGAEVLWDLATNFAVHELKHTEIEIVFASMNLFANNTARMIP